MIPIAHQTETIHFYAPAYSKAKLGEEVLIEALFSPAVLPLFTPYQMFRCLYSFLNPRLQSVLIRSGDSHE